MFQELDFRFDLLKKNISVNVSYNSISEIRILGNSSNWRYVPYQGIYSVPVRHFFVEGNPVNCDCKAYTLLEYHGDKITAQIKFMFGSDPKNLHCVEREGHTEEIHEYIPINYFTCLFEKEFNLNCPEECSCLFRTSDKALIANCQQRNLTKMPGALPDIYFSIFTELRLFGNKIKSVKAPLGPGYYKVTKYNLSDNMISEINLTAFSTKIQVRLSLYLNYVHIKSHNKQFPNILFES